MSSCNYFTNYVHQITLTHTEKWYALCKKNQCKIKYVNNYIIYVKVNVKILLNHFVNFKIHIINVIWTVV